MGYRLTGLPINGPVHGQTCGSQGTSPTTGSKVNPQIPQQVKVSKNGTTPNLSNLFVNVYFQKATFHGTSSWKLNSEENIVRQFKGALNSQWFVRKRFMLKHIETHQLCGSIGASFSIHSLMRSVLQQVITTLHPHFIPRISSLYPKNALIWNSLKVEYPLISIFPITTPFLGYTWIYRHHFQLHFYSPRTP